MKPLLTYATEGDYRAHFERECCAGIVMTFDGIEVRFRKSHFDHFCYKSSKRDGNKDQFCTIRAARIDWIKAALWDSTLPLRVGWDKATRKHVPNRRVVVATDFVVVIIKTDTYKADFCTAYVAEPAVIKKILAGPVWK